MGSSPLTRGKPRQDKGRCPHRGLIPAHAGKTQDKGGNVMGERAHPRSRGENEYLKRGSFISPGSSPLTRGKPVAVSSHEPVCGLIPAHAGKTGHVNNGLVGDRAHPRSRGENRNTRILGNKLGGSSPLTRGKHLAGISHCNHLRLIPAHAGKTAGERSRGGCSRAHPRSRGENPHLHRRPGYPRGSSPLTRGKQPGEELDGRVWGLIPAHAGKTYACRSTARSVWAHPRSRGENPG